MENKKQSGFILPVMVCSLLVVGILVAGALSYVYYGTRVTGMYETASRCRLAAQSTLEEVKSSIVSRFRSYYVSQNSLMGCNFLNWFSGGTSTMVGSGSYSYTAPSNVEVNGCRVTVRFTDFRSDMHFPQSEIITMRATATRTSPHGVTVVKTLEEVVRFVIMRSQVFDYAYFVNNHGWFQGGGVTANGDIRANANFDMDNQSTVNGDCFSSTNPNMGNQGDGRIIIDGGTKVNHETISRYWANQGTRARPTSPTSLDGENWSQGYDGSSSLNEYQKLLEMPTLGNLSSYVTIAQQQNGKISQGGVVLIDNEYSGVGPSGQMTLTGSSVASPDLGSIALIGTAQKPIVLDGPVVVRGDVIIKGYVTGQGVIYAGRNIHIVGDIRYVNPPSWSHPDSNPDNAVMRNKNADLLALAAKGNIVLGNPAQSDWLSDIKSYITPNFVNSYTCEESDASIGYPSVFNGDYSTWDGGAMMNRTTGYEYTYDYRGRVNGRKIVTKYLSASRRYYQSTVGNMLSDFADSGAITRIDATLYNNHAVMGHVGSCEINGSMVCRDEAIIYSGKVVFNWDIRLGSRSRDGMDFDIYLPMTIADPQVIGWREVPAHE